MRHRLGAGLIGFAALGAHAEAAWQAAVDEAVGAACAVRGLVAQAPLDIRPMAERKGGYTAGVGNVVWERQAAEQWRAGWCALGVYCVKEVKESAAASSDSTGDNPMRGPAGLFEIDQNVLYVRDVSSAEALDTVAHETVHALQYQNFPSLHSVHLWYNRDLAAAANTALEGDATVIGSFFDEARGRHLCSMPPDHATASRLRSRGWQPHKLWAHENFPHVFGPELALGRWLADDGSIDDWLRDPPLATLAVLRPQRSLAVDFIDLTPALPKGEIGGRECEAGLANTAGAVGIWGLLRQHGDAAEQLPAFLDHWRGDRFLHLVCPGEGADQLAWVSRWQSAGAAGEFAARYRAIAASVANHGEVLAGAPAPFVFDSTVVVATPALHDAAASLAKAPARTFASFAEWQASGCFPQDECVGGAVAKPAASSRRLCTRKMARPIRFAAWLDRIRRARTAPPAPQTALDAATAAAAELAKFCAGNQATNADWALACRATYYGVHYQAQLLNDPNWGLLPYCATEAEMRDWHRTTYYADAERPFSDADLFAHLYGPAMAGRALAEHGLSALAALAAEPPLSTLAILVPERNSAVDFLRLPQAELAALGCEVAASSVRGVLATWRQLMDDGKLAEGSPPPAFLHEWRGDRQAYVRCGEREGWIGISRWASEDSARAFASAAGGQAEISAPGAEVATVWTAPPALAAAKAVLKAALEVRSYSSFAAWAADGCFPQPACN